MIKVMMVDDQSAARLGFTMMLKKSEDIQMTAQASNGQEALDVLLKLGREENLPDVILMDVRMPVMDGIEATERISTLYPDIKILILTTYDQDEYAFSGLNAGATGFLLKDVHIWELVNAIHAVNDGDAILTPRVTKEILSRGIPADMPHSQTKAMFDALSPRELDVASLVAEGLQNKEIGEMLTIQPESVKRMVNRVLRKLNLHSRIQIAVAWYKAGMKHSTDK